MLSVLLIVACQSTPSIPPEPSLNSPAPIGADPMGVSVHVLDNGLTVFLSENHEEARVRAWTTIRAGGAQDPRDATGMAHYLEHMLANKGTQRLGTLDYAAERPHLERIQQIYDQLFDTDDPEQRAAMYAEIAEASRQANHYAIANELKQFWGLMGGRGFNAFTSHDSTTYVIDLPSNALSQWAALEGDRFAAPVFRSFQTEVETVYEEKNRALDNASRALRQAMLEAVWPNHPYSEGVLGSVEHLKNPSLSKMRAYFETWYVPNNMAVVLSGDFDSDEALALLEQHMGGLQSRPLPEVSAESALAASPAPDGVVRVEVVHEGEEEVQIAWRTVPGDHPDRHALVMVDMLLSNGATGRLEANLEHTQKLAYASSYPSMRRLGGLQVVVGRPKEGQSLQEVEQLLLSEVRALRDGDIDEAHMKAILTNFRVRELGRLEDNEGRVSVIKQAFMLGIPWDEARQNLDRLAEVSPADVQRAAERYLGEDRVVGVRRRGTADQERIEAPPLEPLTIRTAPHSALFTELLEQPREPIPVQQFSAPEDYQPDEYPSGIVYLSRNPYSDLYTLWMRWETGEAADNLACFAARVSEQAGTPDLDRSAFAAELYRLGSWSRLSCGYRSATLTVSGPEENLDAALALVRQRMVDPVLDDAQLGAILSEIVDKRRVKLNTKDRRGSILESWALYGDESPHLRAATDEAILGLSMDQVRAWTRGLLLARRATAYAGNHDPQVLSGLLGPDSELAHLEPAERVYRELPVEPPREYAPLPETRILLLHHPSVQARIKLYRSGERFNAEDVARYELYNEVMGGSAGLVFQEVREARALAYSARGGVSQAARPVDPNVYWVSIGSQTDKVPQSVELALRLMRELPVAPARLDRARASVVEKIRSQRYTFRAIGPALDAWRRQGLRSDPRPDRLAAASALGAADFEALTAGALDKPWVITVVCDTSKVDRAALEALAPVVELSLEELISY